MIRGGIVTLGVSDVDRAVRFYIETLGMKLVEEHGPDLAVIDAGEGFRIGLRRGTTNQSAIELEPKVPIDEAIAIYENRGVVFTIDRAGTTTRARFHDLDNNALTLVERVTTQRERAAALAK